MIEEKQIRCWNCLGAKKTPGPGYVEKDCPACEGRGHNFEVEDDIEFLEQSGVRITLYEGHPSLVVNIDEEDPPEIVKEKTIAALKGKKRKKR